MIVFWIVMGLIAIEFLGLIVTLCIKKWGIYG
jgi:hypothetical protein